jgi:hypothetical protein
MLNVAVVVSDKVLTEELLFNDALRGSISSIG